MIVSTSSSSMRSCGTEYSALLGIVKRCVPETMNWWRVPEKGPSKPRPRRHRTNSRRLQCVHWLTAGLSVQVDPGEHRQRMPELEAHKHPVLQRRAQGVFAFAQGGPEGHHAGTRGNAPPVTAIVELVVRRVAQRRVHIGAQ